MYGRTKKPLKSGVMNFTTVRANRKDVKGFFENYRITVASVIREYDDSNRNEAPADSNEYFHNKQADDRP